MLKVVLFFSMEEFYFKFIMSYFLSCVYNIIYYNMPYIVKIKIV